MLQEVVVPINFGQGVDTKSDPKTVVPGKFLRLENGIFTNVNQVSKRNGYTALSSTIASVGSLSSPKMVHSFNNELIAADQGLLLSYSPDDSAWIERGGYVSTELSRLSIDQDSNVSGCVDSALLGSYTLYGWSNANFSDGSSPPNFPSTVLASIIDTSTNSLVLGPTTLSTPTVHGVNRVKCVLLGSSTLAIIYLNSTFTNLVIRTVSFGGGGVASFSAETTLTPALISTTSHFDVTNTSTGAAVIYPSATGVTVLTLDTTGAITHTSTIADASAANNVFYINSDPTNHNIWAYWLDVTYTTNVATATNIVYAIFSSTLAAVLSKTTVTSVTAFNSVALVNNMIAVITDSTHQILYYGQNLPFGVSTTFSIDIMWSVAVQSNGTVGASVGFANGITPVSRPISVGGQNYAVCVYRGINLDNTNNFISIVQKQPTYFVIQLNKSTPTGIPFVAARFGNGVANTQNILSTPIGYTSNFTLLSGSKYIYTCGITTQNFNNDTFELSNNIVTLNGAFSYFIDFASSNAYKATNTSEVAVLNGGCPQLYDGKTCAELGFHLFPEISDLVQAHPGGSIGAGSYQYLAIFQWMDNEGNLHQSTPSSVAAITVTDASSTVTMHITTGYLSQKMGAWVAVYRTTNAGTVFYQVTNPFFVSSTFSNSVGAIDIGFTDTIPDSTLINNPQAYTYPASPVLENSTTPPSTIMVAHNNRLWFVDSENPNTIWYTKSFSPGNGISPSAFLLEQIDPKFGNITALSEMDDKLVIFKQNGIVIESGDGVNDTGSGSSLSFPQFIPSDVGCDQIKSVIQLPIGVIFHSPNGIYLLSRSIGVSYIGAEVERYNSQIITGTTLVPGKSQVRFLCSTGLTLVYDYIFNKWATFTNHTGLSSSTWNNSYVYSTGSLVFQETAGTYTDNGSAFSLLLQTSWLNIGSIQGFQRVRRLIMLGDYANGNSALHTLSVAAAYDFSTTFQTAISSPPFGSINTSGVFQYRERLPQQKCDTISLLIQETTTGSSLEYIDLTNISFEAGVKRGVNKLSGAQSVG